MLCRFVSHKDWRCLEQGAAKGNRANTMEDFLSTDLVPICALVNLPPCRDPTSTTTGEIFGPDGGGCEACCEAWVLES